MPDPCFLLGESILEQAVLRRVRCRGKLFTRLYLFIGLALSLSWLRICDKCARYLSVQPLGIVLANRLQVFPAHARRQLRMNAGVESTPEILAKREERARKREAQQRPEAIAARAAREKAEVEAKRENRRQRDASDAETLRAWAVKSRDNGEPCDLVDIGANLVKFKGEDTLEQMLRRCSFAGVSRVILTGTSVSSSQQSLELVRRVVDKQQTSGVQLFCTAGVHPHDAKSCNASTMSSLRELLNAPECVAIGECGLDYDRMFSRREVQLEWFEQQARLAAELGLPLFIHERDRDADKGMPLGSHQDLLDVLERAGVRPERACIHCFTGSAAQLQTYVERGYRIGLTGYVAMKERGAHLREALSAGILPLSSLMLETDAPFMRPDKDYLPDIKVLKRGQCEPCVVPAVCNAVAECVSMSADDVARVTTANACVFFGLKS